MIDVSICWRYSLFFLAFALPITAYESEKKAEDIFEKPQEEKVTPYSTFFITPREVKHNYRKYHRINRSVTKIDHFRATEQHKYYLEDLGNHWTASHHIFYKFPQHIGASYGLSAYDIYFQQPQDIRYYYTSKAYAYFNVILANLGSFLFNGCYTQRILENWHIGTNWYGAMSENEWPYTKDDKIVNAFPNFDLFTHVKNSDGRYHLFTSWSNMQYVTRETGGIRSSKKTKNNSISNEFAFTEKNAKKRYNSCFPLLEEPYMENKVDKDKKVVHKELRRNLYLYHHYEYSKPIQLYHELNYNRTKNLLNIEKLDESFLRFISNKLNRTTYTASAKDDNSVLMQSFGNEIGIKGDITNLKLFYAVHYKLEAVYLSYDFSNPEELAYNRPLKEKKKEKEHYIGGNTRLAYRQHRELTLDGVYLLQKGGHHKLNLTYQDKFFKITCHTIKQKTPYIVSCGYTKYRLWDKDFLSPSAQGIDTAISYSCPYITIHPILSFKKINNHIYYRKAIPYDKDSHDHCVAEPVQATAPIYLVSLESNLNFCFFSYFHFDNSFTVLKDVSEGIKIFKGYIPPYIYAGRYYYAHQPYHKKMDIETGLSIQFKELYYGNGYDIISQQFYRQNQFPVQGRPIIDIFCNVRVNNLKLSFKYSYINEYFHKSKGYFTTPFYPGLKKAADIGIHWSFFD